MAYQFETYQNGFVIRLKDKVTFEEMEEFDNALYAHPKFDSHRFQIYDVLDADLSPIDTDEITMVAGTDFASSLTRGNVKVAIVVDNDYNKKLAESYINTSTSLNSSWIFKTFNQLEDAYQWAGLDFSELPK
jgi:hypothetical protein